MSEKENWDILDTIWDPRAAEIFDKSTWNTRIFQQQQPSHKSGSVASFIDHSPQKLYEALIAQLQT